MRRRALLVLIGCGAATLPALALAQSGSSPSVTAQNNFFAPMQATVSAGGAVHFADTSGLSFGHDVDFVIAPAKPQCQGLPSAPSTAAWSGSCTFTQPGTYTFICDRHGTFNAATKQAGGMFGTITVSANGTTTVSTTTTGTTPLPPAPAATALTLRPHQRGSSVKAAVAIGQSGSTLVADLLSTRAQLATRHSTRLGRTTLSGLGAGNVSFTVRLGSRGRAALARRHRLSLMLHVSVTPPSGGPVVFRRHVTLSR